MIFARNVLQILSFPQGIVNVELKNSPLDVLLACPLNCATCSGSNHCLTCLTGYGLQNNLCAPCPEATYLSGNTCVGRVILR